MATERQARHSGWGSLEGRSLYGAIRHSKMWKNPSSKGRERVADSLNQLLSLDAPPTFWNPDFIDSLRPEAVDWWFPLWDPVSTCSITKYYKTLWITGPKRARGWKVTCIHESMVSFWLDIFCLPVGKGNRREKKQPQEVRLAWKRFMPNADYTTS